MRRLFVMTVWVVVFVCSFIAIWEALQQLTGRCQ